MLGAAVTGTRATDAPHRKRGFREASSSDERRKNITHGRGPAVAIVTGARDSTLPLAHLRHNSGGAGPVYGRPVSMSCDARTLARPRGHHSRALVRCGTCGMNALKHQCPCSQAGALLLRWTNALR